MHKLPLGKIERLSFMIDEEREKQYQRWLVHKSHKWDFQSFIATPEFCPNFHALIRQLENCIVERNKRMNEISTKVEYSYSIAFWE